MLARKFEVIQGERHEARRPSTGAHVVARVLRPQRPTVETAVIEHTQRGPTEQGVVIAPALDAEPMSHLWLELDLPVRTIRVLAQVIGHNGRGTHLRVRHCWPKDQELLQRLAG